MLPIPKKRYYEAKESLYDQDFYLWTKKQAKLLRGHRKELASIDVDVTNLAEEIESLGRRDRISLCRHTVSVLVDTLRKKYTPSKADAYAHPAWVRSNTGSAREVESILKDSPSLLRDFQKRFSECYTHARECIAAETGIDIKTFPELCPWELMDIFPFAN